MPMQPKTFDPRQQMHRSFFELQYKRDSSLKDVELHHHDFYELYFLISGDVTYTIESRICRVLPGDILLISPGQLHQVNIRSEAEPYERFVLWLSPEMVSNLSLNNCDLLRLFDHQNPGSVNQLRLSKRDRETTHHLLETLYAETLRDDYGAEIMRRSLVSQFLVQIGRLSLQENTPLQDVSSQFITEVLDYINAHYQEALSLDHLAEHFFISKYHLSHEFNRQVGTSVYRYIQKKRLQVARQLLSQQYRPSHIATACGFCDYTAFYRAFKNEYGYSPREYNIWLQSPTNRKRKR